MRKMKVAVLFGGMSTEHSVSVVSGTSVLQKLKKDKYEIIPIYLSQEGEWYYYTKPIDEITVLPIGEEIKEKEKMENPFAVLKNADIIFPVLHGLFGEDGTVQGMLEMLQKPYVGCKIFASNVCMDKAYAKVIFEKANIPQAPYVYLRKRSGKYVFVAEDFNEEKVNNQQIQEKVAEKLGYPVFIKPANSGSSVGIKKAHNSQELMQCIDYAAQYDTKILIEQNIEGREVECAVLGNGDAKASCVGEILPAEEFYTFDAKYKNAESQVRIPVDLPEETKSKIQEYAVKAFHAVDGNGLSRVDFFVEKKTGKVFLNEINTMPGFTRN